eukprot:5921615-Prymnesium_polylepis.1
MCSGSHRATIRREKRAHREPARRAGVRGGVARGRPASAGLVPKSKSATSVTPMSLPSNSPSQGKTATALPHYN